MYTQQYSKDNPPPTYYHSCGQPVELHAHTTGYSTWDLIVIDGKVVRDCPRCGRHIWRENLIHDMPVVSDADWMEDHAENEDRRYAAQQGVL